MGYRNREIARQVGVEEKTIKNIISKLRGTYGREIVPYRKDLKKTDKIGT
jgi:hypothetical protein